MNHMNSDAPIELSTLFRLLKRYQIILVAVPLLAGALSTFWVEKGAKSYAIGALLRLPSGDLNLGAPTAGATRTELEFKLVGHPVTYGSDSAVLVSATTDNDARSILQLNVRGTSADAANRHIAAIIKSLNEEYGGFEKLASSASKQQDELATEAAEARKLINALQVRIESANSLNDRLLLSLKIDSLERSLDEIEKRRIKLAELVAPGPTIIQQLATRDWVETSGATDRRRTAVLASFGALLFTLLGVYLFDSLRRIRSSRA